VCSRVLVQNSEFRGYDQLQSNHGLRESEERYQQQENRIPLCTQSKTKAQVGQSLWSKPSLDNCLWDSCLQDTKMAKNSLGMKSLMLLMKFIGRPKL
jgi:hypothetical protein